MASPLMKTQQSYHPMPSAPYDAEITLSEAPPSYFDVVGVSTHVTTEKHDEATRPPATPIKMRKTIRLTAFFSYITPNFLKSTASNIKTGFVDFHNELKSAASCAITTCKSFGSGFVSGSAAGTAAGIGIGILVSTVSGPLTAVPVILICAGTGAVAGGFIYGGARAATTVKRMQNNLSQDPYNKVLSHAAAS